MKKTLAGLPVYLLFIVPILAIIGIIFGSFFDLSINQAISDSTNGFGQFFEAFGESLGYAMATIAGTLLFMGLKDDKPVWLKILGWALLVLGIVIPTFLLGRAATSEYAFSLKPYFAYPIAFLIIALAATLTYYLAGVEDKDMLIRVGLVILIAMLAQLLVVTIFKYLASRPRYRYLVDLNLNTTGEVFRNWWQWQPSFKPADDHRSFPSGHVATSCVTLLLPLLARAKKKALFPHEEVILYVVAVVYVLVVALARLVNGAHFLSDVSWGALISSSVAGLTLYFGFRHKKEPQAGSVAAD